MPLANYGQTSPAGLDPWPIEQVLAPLAVGNNQAAAQRMLGDYQYQRDAANNLYGQDMQAQHDFARQQLAATMADQRAKNLQGFIKEPGGLAIAAASPEYSDLLGGADPRVVQGVIGQQTRLQDATVAEKGGAGAWSLTNAGLPPNPQDIANLTRLGINPGTPIPIQVAQLKLQGDMARAGASRGKETKFNIPLKYIDENGQPASTMVPIPEGFTEAQIQQRVDNARRAIAVSNPQGTGTAGQVGPSGDQSVAPPPKAPGVQTPAMPANRGGPSRTSLTPAAPAAPAAPATPAGQTLTDPKIQAIGARTLADSHLLSPAAKSQIIQNAPGGVLPMFMAPDGKTVVFVGKDGKVYRPGTGQ